MIKIEHVSKRFRIDGTEVTAVNDVSLTIRTGEIFGIIGFSGAGKSTLVRCLNCLERPDSGSVTIEDTNVTALTGEKLRQCRRQIGMIFQHFNLMPSRTVYENVEMPLKLTALTREQREQKILNLLELVGLADKRNTYPSQLSGGQKQRVAIARALANDPKVLLCDEATSALDPQTTQSILSLLKKVNAKLGITLVVITHQMSVIKEICDRVAVMEKGKIVETGTVTDIFSSPQAQITRNFIDAADNIGNFFELVKSNPEAIGIRPGQSVWFLTYRGQAAGEPLMVELFRRFQVKANIVYGNVDFFKGSVVGKLGVGIDGSPENIAQSKAYLQNHNVHVEVLL
ncbi:MAG TPA: ATP-binding cassette domain-containing protein [Candidatus Aphodousia gallistercoris]|nr:ATP-binding cassette domain-containing protein [Candidatus Aphodousia gallistercoris]